MYATTYTENNLWVTKLRCVPVRLCIVPIEKESQIKLKL